MRTGLLPLCCACAVAIATVACGGSNSPLYSLPHGARVESDGRWQVPGSGESGVIDDRQAAQDVIDWNMNAAGRASFRERGIITRWDLPVRVYVQ